MVKKYKGYAIIFSGNNPNIPVFPPKANKKPSKHSKIVSDTGKKISFYMSTATFQKKR